MRLPVWSALAAVTVATVLLSSRVWTVALWLPVISLVVWYATVARVPPGRVNIAVSSVVVVFVAAGAGGHLGLTVWAASYGDSVVVYAVLAVVGCARVAQARDPFSRTPSRAPAVLLGVAAVGACCLGGVVLVTDKPVRPPLDLGARLPAGFEVTHESDYCGAGPQVTCTWSLEMDSVDRANLIQPPPTTTTDAIVVVAVLDLPERQCWTWGWLAREHVCLEHQVRRDNPFPRPGPVPGPARETAHMFLVITYW